VRNTRKAEFANASEKNHTGIYSHEGGVCEKKRSFFLRDTRKAGALVNANIERLEGGGVGGGEGGNSGRGGGRKKSTGV